MKNPLPRDHDGHSGASAALTNISLYGKDPDEVATFHARNRFRTMFSWTQPIADSPT